jgi:hypothetical protein
MRNNKPIGAFIVLYIPWLLSIAFDSAPAASYLIAWLGSFFIFYITLTGKLKPLPADRAISEQLMRPIFLMQIIFAGFMCCTSIFYFLDVLGYQDFKKADNLYLLNTERLELTAQCQRYYCLAHASLVSGILVFMQYPVKKKYHTDKGKLANLLLAFALVTLAASTFFLTIPALGQLYFQFSSLSFIAGTLALAFAIPLRKPANTVICILLYFFNLYEALVSGFKEPIIISVLVLGVFLYPNFKRVVTLTFVPLLLALFFLLPVYNRAFRAQSWDANVSDSEAGKVAVDAVMSSRADESNWTFFAFRLSEIDMFTLFVKSTPDHIDYYGTTLFEQAVSVLVPRVFWPDKPSTEEMVMARVYNAGVVNRGSNVSAKPAFVVDAYLSGGPFGIFIFLFIYGAAAQLISLKAERLFGGYILGTALIFSGLFQIFWRGLSIEFLLNSVCWSYISMLVIFRILLATKILKEI